MFLLHSEFEAHCGLHIETLSQKKKKKEEREARRVEMEHILIH
jgi:hypothetical protein